MDVALIIERMEPWRGGAETSTMQFAQHLAGDGCKVSVLTTSRLPSTPELTIVSIPAPRTFRAARTVLFARRAAAYLRRHSFDVVHCITPCPVADVYQPRGGTVPEMLERNAALRASAVRRGFKRLGQRLSLKYRSLSSLERRLVLRRPPPWVIAISEYVARQLQRHYRLDPARIVKVFNGVDPDRATDADRQRDRTQIRRHYHLGPDEPVVLCVAHNFKLKGVARLIEALTRPEAQDYRALIVGRDNPSSYAQMARRLGVDDRVVFTGPTQRMPAFFHAADVLAHPTYYDPCSRVALEALACGLPVITTRFNGAAERITDGVQGYVLDSPEDVQGLAECLRRLADFDHRQACAERATAATFECSMAEHARRIRELYTQILGDRARREVGPEVDSLCS